MSTDKRDIDDLLRIMAALRDPEGGCPWDLQQDFSSIAPYTIEEAYEVADAIDRGDMDDLKDELGDLLLQVVFHAQMANEAGAFDFSDVSEAICDKMTRRHPHVFADASIEDAEAQTVAWEVQKQAERAAKNPADDSALAGIARGLPEWQRAVKLQSRAARTGFDWPDHRPVIAKLREELEELDAEFDAREAAPEDAGVQARLREELGDVLFVAANLARHAKLDPGDALRAANRKFETRFRAMEALAKAEGRSFGELDLAAQEALWQRVKAAR
ncbi:MAG: nucleoside triphosphate pyrophosphohydrolase [Xanthomonadaceae bacterium]|nr:nucleoside triphosphate pyrophosphohydrolase [Xanthomonadaceae bacterium]